nr:MAG TPA: hypothetical protein [Caudoviricetes sp.]
MELVGLVISVFLAACAVVACVRAGKLVIRTINTIFDRIEDRFMN